MDWLNNPIANMYGPHFLLFYGAVIGLTLAVCWWMLRSKIDSPSSSVWMPSQGRGSDSYINNEVARASLRIKAVGALIIAGLGGYKLLVALTKGRSNVLFLILMGIGALWFLFTMSPLPRRK